MSAVQIWRSTSCTPAYMLDNLFANLQWDWPNSDKHYTLLQCHTFLGNCGRVKLEIESDVISRRRSAPVEIVQCTPLLPVFTQPVAVCAKTKSFNSSHVLLLCMCILLRCTRKACSLFQSLSYFAQTLCQLWTICRHAIADSTCHVEFSLQLSL